MVNIGATGAEDELTISSALGIIRPVLAKESPNRAPNPHAFPHPPFLTREMRVENGELLTY